MGQCTLKDRLEYHKYLLQCLEAKIERVEPGSSEFEDVVKEIFETRENIKSIGFQIVKNKLMEEELKIKHLL